MRGGADGLGSKDGRWTMLDGQGVPGYGPGGAIRGNSSGGDGGKDKDDELRKQAQDRIERGKTGGLEVERV